MLNVRTLRDRVHLHEGHEMRIVSLLSDDFLRHDDPFPCLSHRGRMGQKPEKSCKPSSSFAACSVVMPGPFSLGGRVATAQNSTRFCGAT